MTIYAQLIPPLVYIQHHFHFCCKRIMVLRDLQTLMGKLSVTGTDGNDTLMIILKTTRMEKLSNCAVTLKICIMIPLMHLTQMFLSGFGSKFQFLCYRKVGCNYRAVLVRVY